LRLADCANNRFPFPLSAAGRIVVSPIVIEPDGGGGAAACVTVKTWPATDRPPVLAPPEFDATEYVTDPGPFPLAGDTAVIHVA
jgi:hypothetical protein